MWTLLGCKSTRRDKPMRALECDTCETRDAHLGLLGFRHEVETVQRVEPRVEFRHQCVNRRVRRGRAVDRLEPQHLQLNTRSTGFRACRGHQQKIWGRRHGDSNDRDAKHCQERDYYS